MKIYLAWVLLLFGMFSATAQVYRTTAYSDKIKSILVNPVDEWDGDALIQLNGEKQIEIRFDELSHEYKTLTYSVIHCNADWTRSDLSPIEYIQGFQEMPINDYLFSFNTTMNYTNYRLVLPNEDTRFKVSGNYAVEVYDSGNKEKPLLTACFSVMEAEGIPITAKVSGNTDIDFNKAHQQLTFSLRCRDYRITSPQQELKVYIQQNNRTDNLVKQIQPASILNGEYTYRHNKQLIFAAGNEYRRFETITTAYNGMGVNEVSFHSSYYHVSLFRDVPRANRSYIYDEDQNGRYFPRCVDCENYDSEPDYFFVHFSLNAPEPYLGKVYILSEAFDNLLDARSEMQYSFEEKAYIKTALLKQGSYNYLYLLQETKQGSGLTASTEGNYAETENEYRIWVYHRELGGRYDRLIGSSSIRSQQ